MILSNRVLRDGIVHIRLVLLCYAVELLILRNRISRLLEGSKIDSAVLNGGRSVDIHEFVFELQNVQI